MILCLRSSIVLSSNLTRLILLLLELRRRIERLLILLGLNVLHVTLARHHRRELMGRW